MRFYHERSSVFHTSRAKTARRRRKRSSCPGEDARYDTGCGLRASAKFPHNPPDKALNVDLVDGVSYNIVVYSKVLLRHAYTGTTEKLPRGFSTTVTFWRFFSIYASLSEKIILGKSISIPVKILTHIIDLKSIWKYYLSWIYYNQTLSGTGSRGLLENPNLIRTYLLQVSRLIKYEPLLKITSHNTIIQDC